MAAAQPQRLFKTLGRANYFGGDDVGPFGVKRDYGMVVARLDKWDAGRDVQVRV